MDASSLYTLVNSIAFFTWIFLMIGTYNNNIQQWVFRIVISGFAALYTFLLFSGISNFDINGFQTLEGLTGMFADQDLVLTGWVHYLCFDLVAGMYIARDGNMNDVPQFVLIPCLLFCFFSGPFGLLLYLLIRLFYRKSFTF